MNTETDIEAAARLSPIIPAGISVVVPVYNSSQSLPKLVERLIPVVESFQIPFEVLLVNDGSSDQSWDVIRGLVEQHHRVRGMCMMRNYGQHNALLAGVRAARYDITATLDDDLQHPPEELPKLFRALHGNVDVVYGWPERGTHGFLRNIASLVTKLTLQGTMGAHSVRHVSAFRVFRTELRRAFSRYESPFVSLDVLLSWGTANFAVVRVKHEQRRLGQSSYTVWKLIRHAWNMVTGFSALPLQLASVIGFTFSFAGFAVLGYVLWGFMMYGRVVAGFPFLASIIAIFSGVQLFALGVLGQYLARIHFRAMNRPAYAIREVVGEGGAPQGSFDDER
jgi:glycosyltransferase involved in cell wall biosynthesis